MTEAEHEAALRCAVERVRRGWCQHELAVDADGEAIAPDDPEAAAWCLVGAVDAGVLETTGCVEDANAVLMRLRGGGGPLSEWNDEPGRTAEEVVERLEGALR